MSKPKYRRPLNPYQILLLQALYKFRFASSYHIADNQNKNHVIITARLRILLDQEYIGRKYDNSYKLKGKPAIYFLRPRGVQYLRLQTYSSPKVLNSIYQDIRASDNVVAHHLALFDAYNNFNRLYPASFKYYSKSEIARMLNLPRRPPDAQLSRIKPSPDKDNDFFLDYYENSLLYNKLIVKIRNFISYAESGDWAKITDDKFPSVLMICESKKVQYRVRRLVVRELDSTYVDLNFLAITKSELDDAITPPEWMKISNDNESVEL